MRDKVFANPIEKQFEFDESVATVFDDMLDRSIPFYKEVIELIANIVSLNVEDNSVVLDLGCSTANTLLYLHKIYRLKAKIYRAMITLKLCRILAKKRAKAVWGRYRVVLSRFNFWQDLPKERF